MKGMETGGNRQPSDQPAKRIGRKVSIEGDPGWWGQARREQARLVHRRPSADPGLRLPGRGVKQTRSGHSELTLRVDLGGERQDTSSSTAERTRRPLDGLIIGSVEQPGPIDERPSTIPQLLGSERDGNLLFGERPYTLGLGERLQWYESGPKPGRETAVHQAIAKSANETGKQFLGGLLEKAVVAAAHCVAPGFGHIVVLFFEAKELLEDVAALASSDKPVELHIPLLRLPPGIELEVGVELGGDGENDGPGLIVFFAPSDGGVLHGWGLERENGQTGDKEEEAKRKRAGCVEEAVIQSDLSPALKEHRDQREIAAILRHLGIRLQAELWEMDECRGASCITIYDERAGLGLWLPRPEDTHGAQKIVLEEDVQTGRLIVRLVAT